MLEALHRGQRPVQYVMGNFQDEEAREQSIGAKQRVWKTNLERNTSQTGPTYFLRLSINAVVIPRRLFERSSFDRRRLRLNLDRCCEVLLCKCAFFFLRDGGNQKGFIRTVLTKEGV